MRAVRAVPYSTARTWSEETAAAAWADPAPAWAGVSWTDPRSEPEATGQVTTGNGSGLAACRCPGIACRPAGVLSGTESDEESVVG